MTLINLKGLSFFGPGSEWFWSMLQFALVAITLIGIYRQLQAQRWATEVALRTALQDQWTGERMVRTHLAAAMHVLQGQPGVSASLEDVANWMEGLSEDMERGLLQRDYIWSVHRIAIQGWWASMATRIMEQRAIKGHLLWVGFENLAQEMAKLDREAGLQQMDLSPEKIREGLQELIAASIERLELENDLKSGVIPSWPPVSGQTPAPVGDQ